MKTTTLKKAVKRSVPRSIEKAAEQDIETFEKKAKQDFLIRLKVERELNEL